MGGIKKSVKRWTNPKHALKRGLRLANPIDAVKVGAGDLQDVMTPEMPKLAQPEAQKYIAPDEEAIARARRRRGRSSSAATIMSTGDGLGG